MLIRNQNHFVFRDRGILLFALCLAGFSSLLWGCSSKTDKQAQPEDNPKQVVEKFYSLLKHGGKRTLEEAQKLTNSADGLHPSVFRRWTEKYDPETEVTVLESRVLDESGKGGETIAEVNLEYRIPSLFGGYMKSTTSMHLVLDRETNSWKIDFLAETMDEEGFKREG